MTMNKRIQRSSSNCILGGVCGGLADYFELDPTLVRVIYVLLTVCTAFSGTLVYILLWIIMPKEISPTP